MLKKTVLFSLFLASFVLSACGQSIEIIEVTEGDNSLFEAIDDQGNLVLAE
jgi:hypothetical protein